MADEQLDFGGLKKAEDQGGGLDFSGLTPVARPQPPQVKPEAAPSMAGEFAKGAKSTVVGALQGGLEAPANWIEQHAVAPAADWMFGQDSGVSKAIHRQAESDVANLKRRQEETAKEYAPAVPSIGEALESPGNFGKFAAHQVGAAVPWLGAGLARVPAATFGALGAMEGGTKAYDENKGDLGATAAGAVIGAGQYMAPMALIKNAAGKSLIKSVAENAAAMGGIGAAGPVLEKVPGAVASGDWSQTVEGGDVATGLAGGLLQGALFGVWGKYHGDHQINAAYDVLYKRLSDGKLTTTDKDEKPNATLVASVEAMRSGVQINNRNDLKDFGTAMQDWAAKNAKLPQDQFDAAKQQFYNDYAKKQNPDFRPPEPPQPKPEPGPNPIFPGIDNPVNPTWPRLPDNARHGTTSSSPEQQRAEAEAAAQRQKLVDMAKPLGTPPETPLSANVEKPPGTENKPSEPPAAPAAPTPPPEPPPQAPPGGASAQSAHPEAIIAGDLRQRYTKTATQDSGFVKAGNQYHDVDGAADEVRRRVADALSKGYRAFYNIEGKRYEITGIGPQGQLIDHQGNPWGAGTLMASHPQDRLEFEPRRPQAPPGAAGAAPTPPAPPTPPAAPTPATAPPAAPQPPPRDWTRLTPQQIVDQVSQRLQSGQPITPDEIAYRTGVSADYANQILQRGHLDAQWNTKPLDAAATVANRRGVSTSQGPYPDSSHGFVIDQVNPDTGDFEGSHIMLGFPNQQHAVSAYKRDPSTIGAITPLPLNGIRTWLDNGDTSKPLGQIQRPAWAVDQFTGKDGNPIFAVQPQSNPGSQGFKDLGKLAAQLGGQWDYAKPSMGFVFPNRDAANQFSQAVRQKMEQGQQPPVPPAPQPPRTSPPTPPEAPQFTGSLAQRFAQAFAAGHDFSLIIAARKFAANQGHDDSTPQGRKALDEAIEQGVVIHARQLAASGLPPEQVFDRLVDLYKRQPRLYERNSDSMARQAYSTPAPLAYIASRLAGVTHDKVVYEPTAGNGSLLIESNPARTISNEIDPARRDALKQQGFDPTGHDAAAYSPADHMAIPIDVVLANPPFGKVRDYAKGENTSWPTPEPTWRTEQIDHAIAFRALAQMQDNGSAVLLIGGKPEIGAEGADRRLSFYRSNENRAFFKMLYDRYNVADHFTVDGKLYDRQGAGWPIDVIVIKGRGQTDLADRPLPGVAMPRIYRSWDELKSLFNAANDTRNGALGTPENKPGGNRGERPAGDADVGRLPGPNGDQGGPHDKTGGRGSGEGDNSGRPTPPEQLVSRPPDTGVGGGPDGGTRPGDSRPPESLPGGRDLPSDGQGGKPVGQGGDEGRPIDVAGHRDPEGTGLTPEELDAFNAAFGPPPEQTPPGQPGQPPAQPPAGPRPEQGQRPSGEQPPENKPDDSDWRKRFGQMYETPTPPPERSWLAGVDPDRYQRALPIFVDAVKDLGYKTGDNLQPVIAKLVDELKNSGFTPEQMVRMRPDALQFMDDVKRGVVRFDAEERPPEQPPKPPEQPPEPKTPEQPPENILPPDAERKPDGDVVSKRRANTEVETRLQVPYKPMSEGEPVGTLVPVNMQTAVDRSLADLKSRIPNGDIDQWVADKLGYSKGELIGTEKAPPGRDELGRDPLDYGAHRPGIRWDNNPNMFYMDTKPGFFSAEQIDALALAIDNLDNGSAMIIGDQTGVGKGRVVAGAMRYAIKTGRVPIFFTADKALYADMYRDLRDIGMDSFKALPTNNDLTGKGRIPLERGDFVESLPDNQLKAAYDHILKTGRLPQGFDALFTSYSQVQGKDSAQRRRILEALAPNALIVMDESHQAGGTENARSKNIVDKKTGAVSPAPMTRSQWARTLLADADGALFSSATYAKNPHVMGLYFRVGMADAVGGNVDRLIDLTKRGGVPLQQVMANMATEAGRHIRRERSFDGVEMPFKTVETDKPTAERNAEMLRRVYDFDRDMDEARKDYNDWLQHQGNIIGPDNAIGTRGAEGTGFSQIMHNIIGQGLLSLKAKQAVDEAVAAHSRGEKPIIAVSNTFGALMDRYVTENGLKTGDDMRGLDFNKVHDNYLKRTRTVLIKHPFDETQNHHHYITDDELKMLGHEHLIDDFNKASKDIADADLSSMPGSPLDYIKTELRKAGLRVGEITGRKGIINDDGMLDTREHSGAAKKRTMNAFNAGDLDALLINQAGSTGFSLHASRTYADQKQRHMIMLQAEPNIDTFMQLLGRIHRTGQVVLPKYTFLSSDLPAEKRPAAVLMKKMAHLNANTSANKESGFSMDNVVDLMNKYGDDVVGTLLMDEPEIATYLDLHRNTEGEWADGIVSKATGRLAILPIDKQESFWDRASQNYKDLIDTLDRTGQNTLEAKTLDLDAESLSATQITQDQGTGSPFGKPAVLESMNINRLGKPYTMDEVRKRIADHVKSTVEDLSTNGANIRSEHIRQLQDDLRDSTSDYLGKLNADQDEAISRVTLLQRDYDKDDKQKVAAMDKATRRVANIKDQIQNIRQQQSNIQDFLGQWKPGAAVRLTVGDGPSSESFHGIVLGVGPTGKTTNPAAYSGWTVHLAIADGSRELPVPLSQFMGKDAKAHMESSSMADVQKEFDEGQSGRKEKRYIITGNLVSGYDAFHGRGQFIMFTRSDGSIEQGIMLPRRMNPEQELANRPVSLTIPQIFPFLDRVQQLLKRSSVVHSEDGNFKISRVSDDKYLLQAMNKGGQQYHLPKDVQALLGDKIFATKKGDKFLATSVDKDTAQKVMQWYQDNLGTKFEARADMEHARAITGTGGGEPQDLTSDYQAHAQNAGTPPHETVRNWLLQKGGETGNEHLVMLDPKGNAIQATTSGQKGAVGFYLRPETFDPKSNLIAHHNHPGGRSLSGDDISIAAYPGHRAIVAHGQQNPNHSISNPGEFYSATLTPQTRRWVDGEWAKGRPQGATAVENLKKTWEAAFNLLMARASDMERSGKFTYADFDPIHCDLANRALNAAGIIDYVGSRDTFGRSGLPEVVLMDMVRDAARAAMDASRSYGFQIHAEGEALNDRVNRSSGYVSPADGMARLSSGHAEASERGRQEPPQFSEARENADRSTGRKDREAGVRPGTGPERSVRQVSEVGEEGRIATARETEFGTPAERSRALARIEQTTDRGLAKTAKDIVKGVSDKGVKQSAQDLIDYAKTDGLAKATQRIVDDLTGLQNVEKEKGGGKLLPRNLSPTQQARFARNFASQVELWVNHSQGRYNPDTGVVEPVEGSKGLKQIMAPIAQLGRQGMNDFHLWLMARRSAKLLSEGREQNMKEEDIDRYINLADMYQRPDGSNPFKAAADDIKGWHKSLLDFGEAAGIFNPDSRALFEHDEYVPYFRAMDQGEDVKGPKSGGSRGRVFSPIKQLKGSENKVNNLTENMVMNAQAIIRRSMENMVLKRTADELADVHTLVPLSKGERDMIEAETAHALRDSGDDLKGLGINPDLIDATKAEARGLWTALKRKDTDIIRFLRDGKPVYYRVKDPLLLDSLASIGPNGMNWMTKLLSGPARLLRAAVIFDPAFMVAHNLRMAQHAAVLTGVNPLAAMSDAVRAWKMDPIALKLMASGATSGHYDIGLAQKVRMQIDDPTYQKTLLNTPLKVAKFVKMMSDRAMKASDTGPRMAVYEKAKREGATEAEALDKARDLLDFSMHGDGGPVMFLAQTIPFLNARWQGLYRTGRGLLGEDRKAILMRGALMTAATMALWQLNQQENQKEWARKEDWDKQYAHQFWIDGVNYRLPKAWEISAVFSTIPEMMMDYMNDGNFKHLNQAGVSLFSNVFKFNPIPVALSPLIDAYTNHDSFTGRPVVSPSEMEMLPSERFGPTTSPAIVGATRAYDSIVPAGMQVSPEMVQHLLTGYFAGWGSYMAASADWIGDELGMARSKPTPRATDYPVISRFARESPETSNRVQTDFYDLKTKIDEVGKSIKAAQDRGDADTFKWLQSEHPEYSPGLRTQLDAAGKMLAQRRAMLKKQETNPMMTPDQKRAASDAFYTWRDKYMDSLAPLIAKVQQ